jgi:hypothetical protein
MSLDKDCVPNDVAYCLTEFVEDTMLSPDTYMFLLDNNYTYEVGYMNGFLSYKGLWALFLMREILHVEFKCILSLKHPRYIVVGG